MTKISRIECNMQRLERMVREGKVESEVVMPLACIFDAVRNAQILLGPGHLPLAALLDQIPVAYIQNYLKGRKKRGWRFTDSYQQSELVK